MKHVLFVAYGFPPVGGAGVQRTVKFVKYLKAFGWQPSILTVKNPSVPIYDPKQIADIPRECKIFRAKTLEPSYSLKNNFLSKQYTSGLSKSIKRILRFTQSIVLLPDPQILWWPLLIFSLIRILRSEKVECIFVSAPPFSSLVPVTLLGKLFDVPVVADYRDDWSFSRSNIENAVKTLFARMVDDRLERFVILNCDALTVATRSYAENILRKFPSTRREKCYVITNGYDSSDFSSVFPKKCPSKTSLKVNFLYSGTVWKATSLFPFVRAINLLLRVNKEIDKRIHIRIVGRIVDHEAHYFLDPRFEGLIDLISYVPHVDIIDEMNAADVLLLSLSDFPGADHIIPGKTFEYMATGKHILALVPEGETKRLLIEEYGNATIVDPGKVELISENILKLVSNIELLRVKKEIDVSRYERKALTEKLATVLSIVAKKGKNVRRI